MQVDKNHQSLFECLLKTSLAYIPGSEDLREPPIFTKELHDMEVDDGDRVEMSVEVKGKY